MELLYDLTYVIASSGLVLAAALWWAYFLVADISGPAAAAIAVGLLAGPDENIDLTDSLDVTALVSVTALVALGSVVEVVGHELVGYEHTSESSIQSAGEWTVQSDPAASSADHQMPTCGVKGAAVERRA